MPDPKNDERALDALLADLVVANRILAREDVLDDFGHVAVRHPERPDRFFLSRSRSPELVTRDDLMEFDLEGAPVDPQGKRPYLGSGHCQLGGLQGARHRAAMRC